MVCRNEEITILREFQSRKESLKYLQKLPLEHKISLSKNLILNCIETFGDQQVYQSGDGRVQAYHPAHQPVHVHRDR